MRIYRSLIGYAFAALACFGYTGFATAADAHFTAAQTLRFAVADVGYHGAESAKFKAEQAYMVAMDSVARTSTGGLTAESNGYRLSELVNASVGDSEVAKGKVGVGAGSVA